MGLFSASCERLLDDGGKREVNNVEVLIVELFLKYVCGLGFMYMNLYMCRVMIEAESQKVLSPSTQNELRPFISCRPSQACPPSRIQPFHVVYMKRGMVSTFSLVLTTVGRRPHQPPQLRARITTASVMVTSAIGQQPSATLSATDRAIRLGG